mmetsp:Transcript_31537/g.49391  ORF Transcript_31537/g.49391 Transcript_31537/m.49391 type:complete len:211 (+) Transcript_31537:434-1066(+)
MTTNIQDIQSVLRPFDALNKIIIQAGDDIKQHEVLNDGTSPNQTSLTGTPNTSTGNTRGAWNSYSKDNKPSLSTCPHCGQIAKHARQTDLKCTKFLQKQAAEAKGKRKAKHEAQQAAAKLAKTKLNAEDQSGKESSESELKAFMDSTNKKLDSSQTQIQSNHKEIHGTMTESHAYPSNALALLMQSIFPNGVPDSPLIAMPWANHKPKRD